MVTQKKEIVKENLEEFERHKQFAIKLQHTLAETYKTLNVRSGEFETNAKGLAVLDCGTHLAFQRYFDPESTSTLHGANFCKHKLCPYCAWRWHIKQNAILSKTFEILGPQNYYHLVLTIPNVPYLTKDFLLNLRTKCTTFMRKVAKSNNYFIGFEITIDKLGHFHPHYHIVYIDYREDPMTRKFIQTQWAMIANTGMAYAIAKQTKCTSNKISQELTKYILKFDEIEPSVDKMKVIRFATKGIRKFATAGKILEAEKEAKRELERENFDKMLNLSNYDSLIQVYDWIGNSYSLREEKIKKAGEHD